ncbi:MAG: DUF4190 domain-containing protein [Candidatus Andersenbacteria bacterium]
MRCDASIGRTNLNEPSLSWPKLPRHQSSTGKGTNGFAIASLICGFLPGVSLLAIVFGFVALSQIKQNGEGGRGMAIAGIVLGFLWIVIAIVWVLFAFIFVTTFTRSIIETPNALNSLLQNLPTNNSIGNFNFNY